MKDTIKLNYANGILSINCYIQNYNLFKFIKNDNQVQTPFFTIRSSNLSFCEYSNDVTLFKNERCKVYTLKFKVEDFLFMFEHEEADFSLRTNKTYKHYNFKIQQSFIDEIILE